MTKTLTIINYNDKEQLAEFYSAGETIRKRNSNFDIPWSEPHDVPALIDSYNLITQLLLVTSENHTGRIQAFIFKDNPQHGFLGRYECDNDKEISYALLRTAEDWLRSNGAIKIFGPMNGTTWDSYRFNLIADQPLFPSDPYQPLYYVDHWKDFGFEIELMYETNNVPTDQVHPIDKLQLDHLAAQMELTVENFPKDLIDNKETLRLYFDFYHTCFKENAHFKPISFERYAELTSKLMQVVDFDLSFVVRDQQQRPVSVLVSYKDLYRDLNETDRPKTLFMKTLSTLPEWRGKRLSQTLVNYGCVVAPFFGYDEVVFATMWVDNATAQYSRNVYGATPVRSYALFSKML